MSEQLKSRLDAILARTASADSHVPGVVAMATGPLTGTVRDTRL